MKTNNIIIEKTFEFSVSIIKINQYLKEVKKEYDISRQLLRSGTSIGANVKEALRGQSKKDFLAKMNIALKEADETEYWLELLIRADYLDSKKANRVLTECKEICRILNSIVNTTKNKLNA